MAEQEVESVECCVCLKGFLDGEDRIQQQTNLERDLDGIEENLAENEAELGLSPPVTDISDTSSVGTVSRYDDDESIKYTYVLFIYITKLQVTQYINSSSVGTVSRYNDDEEEPDTDRLDDNTTVERLIKYNSLEEYNPETTTYYTPYNPNNYNPWYYDSSGAGLGSGSAAGGSGTSGHYNFCIV